MFNRSITTILTTLSLSAIALTTTSLSAIALGQTAATSDRTELSCTVTKINVDKVLGNTLAVGKPGAVVVRSTVKTTSEKVREQMPVENRIYEIQVGSFAIFTHGDLDTIVRDESSGSSRKFVATIDREGTTVTVEVANGKGQVSSLDRKGAVELSAALTCP